MNIRLFICLVLCLVSQLCLTLCDPMDCSPPGSSVHGDSPGTNTGVGCMPSSRGSSQPRDWTQVSHTAGGLFTIWATREATVNKADVNVGLQKSDYTQTGDGWIIWQFCFVFETLPHCFLQWLYQFTFRQTVHKVSPFPHGLTSASYSRLFGNSQSNRCEGIAPCGFDVQLPEDWWFWSPFQIICTSSLEKGLFRSFPHILIWFFSLLSYMSSLYDLDINLYQVYDFHASQWVIGCAICQEWLLIWFSGQWGLLLCPQLGCLVEHAIQSHVAAVCKTKLSRGLCSVTPCLGKAPICVPQSSRATADLHFRVGLCAGLCSWASL